MVLLILCVACGSCAFVSAVVLQFRLVGWGVLCGLAFMPGERRGLMDGRRLSRYLSVVLYVVAAVFFSCAFALHARRLSPTVLSRVMLAVLLVAFDLSWTFFRSCDGNEYPRATRAFSSRLLVLCNALFLVALLFLSSCSTSGAGSAVDPIILFAPPGDNGPFANPARRLDPVDGSNVIDVTLTGLAGHSVYLVKENLSPNAVPAHATGSVANYSRNGTLIRVSGALASDDGFAGLSRLSGRSASPRVGGVLRREHEKARRFSESPPPGTVPPSARSAVRSSSRSTPRGTPGSGDRVASRAAVGDSRRFWVENAQEKFVQIYATLRAQRDSCDVWVADANYSTSSSSLFDNRLNAAQISGIADSFEAMRPRMNALFGHERGGGPGGDGGIDGDTRVALLVYDIDFDYDYAQGSGVLGYFWGKDLFIDGAYEAYRSNEAEILYFDAHFADAHADYVKSTLIHEYQHMINYGRFILPASDGGKGLKSVPTWYNEMLSTLAEDLVFPKMSHDDEATARACYPRSSRIPYFLANTGYFALVGLTDWSYSGDALYASYGSAYAFGAYLARNWGGVALVSRLMNGSSAGEQAIAEALYELNDVNGTAFERPTGEGDLGNFREAVRRYGEAYVFSGPSRPAGLASFSNESAPSTVELDGTAFDYDVAGFDIWETENSVKHESNPSLPHGMKGPFVWVFEDYPLRPYAIDLQSCEDWLNVTGDLSVTVNLPPPGSGVELFLMVR